MKSTLPLICWAVATSVLADGPGDNLPDKVRRVPPPGIAIPAADRSELEAGVAELGKVIDSLRTELKSKPALLGLLPDVQIYHKAVDWALRYDEFYKTNEAQVARAEQARIEVQRRNLGRIDVAAAQAGIAFALVAAAGNLDGVYWQYETRIKMLESRFGCVLGANGAIYAFRRERYEPLPHEAIIDDFLIPVLMRMRSGGRVFFVPTAMAWETSPEKVGDEFRRRVRIGAGDLQALLWTWRLLLPWKGMVAVAYFSHKVLRWLGPWFMVVGFMANLWLLDVPFFQVLFIGQLVMYGLALGATLVHHVPILGKAATGARYFLVLNAALLLGFVRFASGLARPTWDTTPRTD